MAEGDGEPLGWVARMADAVRDVHARAVRLGGGLEGEYPGRLESVCARPFQHVFGEELFPTAPLKAAALFHGVIAGHVFADGNKRTASLAAVMVLMGARFMDSRPSPLQVRLIGEVAVETALSTSLSVEEIGDWFERILRPGP